MYDDDFYSILNSLAGNTTTTTEQQTEQQTTTTPTYSAPSTPSYNPWADDDDYSVNQNYEEQKSYNSVNQSYDADTTASTNDVFEVRQMTAPMIKREEPAVNLIKKRQRIELGARMKIVASMFAIIVASLIVAIVWNFANAASMKASFAGKQVEINALTQSIMGLKEEYNLLSDDEQIKSKAENAGYVDSTDDNTIVVDFDSYYAEQTLEEVPSNWFNDVCDFLSKLFA
jgi:cell division protein FtsL